MQVDHQHSNSAAKDQNLIHMLATELRQKCTKEKIVGIVQDIDELGFSWEYKNQIFPRNREEKAWKFTELQHNLMMKRKKKKKYISKVSKFPRNIHLNWEHFETYKRKEKPQIGKLLSEKNVGPMKKSINI